MPNKSVPQGSVVGPLLCNVYVSSLQDAARAKYVSLPSFADDFTLYSIRPTMTKAADAATSALQDISILLEEEGLTISAEKKCINDDWESFFNQCSQMYLNNSPIEMVSQAILLGVTVDENLTWSAHINALHRRICRSIGVLWRTMSQPTSPSRRQFLITVIQPDFVYAAVAFVPSMSMSGKQRLLALLRKAVRWVAMADCRADIAPLLVHLKINAIEHRWALQFALLVRRCLLQAAMKELLDKPHRTSHGLTTRGQGIAFKPFWSKPRSGSISFSNRVPLVWNFLDEDMKTCSSWKFRTKFLSLISSSTALLSLTLFDPVWPSVSLSLFLSLSLSLLLTLSLSLSPSLSLTLILSLSLSLSLSIYIYIYFTPFFLLLPPRPLPCAVGTLKVDSFLLNLSYNKQTFLNWTELNWTCFFSFSNFFR